MPSPQHLSPHTDTASAPTANALPNGVAAPDLLAQCLGYAGLIPFVLLAALLWVQPGFHTGGLAQSLTHYAALIATFLGGIHWAIAATQPQTARRFHYIWGVIPSLLAWLGMSMPILLGMPSMAALLVVCYAVDRTSYPAAGWSEWLPLRLRLTVVGALSCSVGAAALVKTW